MRSPSAVSAIHRGPDAPNKLLAPETNLYPRGMPENPCNLLEIFRNQGQSTSLKSQGVQQRHTPQRSGLLGFLEVDLLFLASASSHDFKWQSGMN
jgi:hypothetical protein